MDIFTFTVNIEISYIFSLRVTNFVIPGGGSRDGFFNPFCGTAFASKILGCGFSGGERDLGKGFCLVPDAVILTLYWRNERWSAERSR